LYFRNNVASDILEQLRPLTGSFKLAVKRNEGTEKAYASTLKGVNPGGGNDLDLQIAEVSPPLDTPAQSRTVEVKINNSSGLLEPGTYYQVKIYGTGKQRVLSVPKDSIAGDAEPCVFVIGPDGRLERRTVKTGIRDDEYVEIQSGLAENETVAVAGKDTVLEPGTKVQAIQAP
jgi:multidrug efflux pump subunit AcrA (membrane-fusion protein)